MVDRVMEGMQLAKWARRIAMIDGGNVGDKKVDMRLRKVGRQGCQGTPADICTVRYLMKLPLHNVYKGN
jgi:hypothetical protein